MIDTIKIKFIMPKELFVKKNEKEIAVNKNNIWFRNFKVLGNVNYTLLIGSITRFKYGEVIKNFTSDEVWQAVLELQKYIELPLSEINVYRIDIGFNIEVTQPVSYYLQNFLTLNKYDKSVVNDYETIFFNNKSITILFYDKIEKSKKGLKNNTKKYIIRYELQFKNNLKNKLKETEPITLESFSKRKIYRTLLDLWKQYFDKIEKNIIPIKILELDSYEKLTLKSLKDIFCSIGIIDFGIENIGTILKKKEISPNARKDFKEYLKNISKYGNNIKDKNNVLELANKIEMYYSKYSREVFTYRKNFIESYNKIE